MDNSLPQTLSSQDLLSQNNAPQNIGAAVSTSAPIVASSQQAGAPSNPTQNGGNPAVPIKRKPGRPKGSVKKPTPAGAIEGIDPGNKIKRPVGRPRKDGLPAGSVIGSRPRKSAPGKLGVGVPQVQVSKPLEGASRQSSSAAFGIPHPGVCLH